jgi:hypothetical protein
MPPFIIVLTIETKYTMFSSENKFDANHLDSGSANEKNKAYFSSENIPNNHSKVFIEWTTRQHLTNHVRDGKSSPVVKAEPFVIHSEEEFHWALARFNEIIDASPETPEAYELSILENAIDLYWDILYPNGND